MFGIGSTEIFIIALFALLLFGPDKLPQFARTISKFVREFNKYKDTMESTIRAEMYRSDSGSADEGATPRQAAAVAAATDSATWASDEDDEEDEEE